MAEENSFDCAATDTDLLCNEETKALCFDDEMGRSDSEPLILSEECIAWMLEREREHLPRDDYLVRLRSGNLDMSLRKEAFDWIFKACAHHNFGELCLYLAMSYLDRFLSVYNLPVRSRLERAGKTWAIQLVAVACLSLAAKFDEVNVPSTIDLQAGVPKILFEGKTIERMEILVLSYLKWNLRAYTPFDFVEYFLRKMRDVEFSSGHLITRSIQIILSTIKGIDFLEFRPSEIAAAVAVYVSGEIQAMVIDNALSSFNVGKGRVVKCLELIQDLISISGISSTNVSNGSVSSAVPNSPNGVLEAACLSYKSDERRVGSCPNSSHTSPDNKRRKLE